MFLAVAPCVVLGFIVNISGVQGKQKSIICALKGSSVNVSCSAKHPTSGMKWYIQYADYSRTELSADGRHAKYSISEESNFTLTINNLTEKDAHSYCCGETTDKSGTCQNDQSVFLDVADLQVKVIPSTVGQTVTLMCSTSCALTENPAAYIWYKNREFLYEDWSPWYQELLSSDEAVRYSCAVKGYEHLRAPEVSVGSVTSTCFSVTYARGKMCSNKQTSSSEPCSITYPREIRFQMTPAAVNLDHLTLTCSSSCPPTDPQISFTWYKNRKRDSVKKNTVPKSSSESFSCAVTGFEDLLSAEVCADDDNCWSVDCVNRRICAVEGSSVNISSEYSHPINEQPKSKLWHKVKPNAKKEEVQGEDVGHDERKKQNILRLKDLKKSDSAEYMFSISTSNNVLRQCGFSGVSLIVTGLTVTMTPSAEVTEGQRVTLTCSTSCPLTDNTNYIWYLNNSPHQRENKHLVLDPVSVQHAGSYSCAVKTHKNITSPVKTLTVRSTTRNGGNVKAVAAGVGAALVVLILVAVILWIRKKKRTSSQSPKDDTVDNLEQYSEIAAQPAEQEHYYSTVHVSKNHTDALYSTVQPHQPQEQELIPYAVVKFRHTDQAVDM